MTGMDPVGLVPLVLAFALAGLVVLSASNRRVDTALTRLSRRYFGRYVDDEHPERTRQLRAAFVDETYRAYAARTYLLTVVAALVGSVVGVYVFGAGLLVLPALGDFIDQLPDAIANGLGRPELEPELTPRQVLAVVTAGGVLSGAVTAGVAYWYRWESPKNHAEVRRRGINEGLPRTVAFVYALSRGGMAVPEVMRSLAHNRSVYGHGADEVSVAVREMDLFGRDIITAVRHVSERTPSEQFKTFSENLASVLQSGKDLSGFLRGQYERYSEQAQERQDEILELLATIAEAYVTVLVAGTLFLMTILLVFGLTTTQTINFLRLLAYLLIPLANVLFIVYLDGKLDLLGVSRGSDTGNLEAEVSDSDVPRDLTADRGPEETNGVDAAGIARSDGIDSGAVARSDGGATASGDDLRDAATRPPADSGKRLALYDRLASLKRVAGDPVQTVLWNPTRLLYLTVPLALLWVAFRAPSAVSPGGFEIRIADDIVIQAVLFVVGTFALVWELYSRRIRRMEAELPELLGRLASLNQAGMSVVESIERVRESDLGLLSPEVDRVWRDLQYGATVDDAFRRFGLRVRTTATTRVVTLLTNALRASGNVAPVLRIASEQAESELQLRRRRRQQMLTYLVVIYISFLVFLVIIVAVQEVLVPSLPTDVPVPSADETRRLGVNAGQFARFAEVDKAAYTLVFFHTALVQAVLSGFIGGQLGEGSLKDGAKHATVMLTVAYIAFLLLTSPVATVTFTEQTMSGDTVVVDSVSLSNGGYVVVHQQTSDGQVVGHSAYLEPGTHQDVRVRLDSTYAEEMTLFAVTYLDSNGNGEFDPPPGETADTAYTATDSRVFDRATVTRDSDDSAALDASSSTSLRESVGSLAVTGRFSGTSSPGNSGLAP
jgi:flagellar protein FlaJ